VFLNHQHPDEYVLLFSDGHAHVSLHYDFEESIKRLIEVWATKKGKRLMWHWRPSCECAKEQQKQFDAAYYNRRGLFQLSRKNWELALAYLREACVQNSPSREFQYNHRMALAAVRRNRNDEILEGYLDQASGM
jgi:hypothetical protein